jgi:tetratricopeptide (TPR) repeat protein
VIFFSPRAHFPLPLTAAIRMMIGAMDADTLVTKAEQAIQNGDYELAKEYLKEAAGLAPLRTDVRDMLEFVLQQKPTTKRKARSRGLFQTERERAAGPFAASEPRRRSSWVTPVITFILVALVVGGGVAAFLVWRPQLVRFSQGGSTEDSTTTSTAVTEVPSPAGTPSQPGAELPASVESLVTQSKYEEAIQLLKKTLDGNPDNRETLTKRLAELQFSWGKELFGQSKLDEAVKNLQSAAEVDQRNPNVYFWLGQSYLLKGKRQQKTGLAAKDYQKAEQALKESVRLDPEMLQSYCALARTYSALAQPDKAAKYYNEVIRKSPDSAEAERARNDLRMMDLR